LRIAAERTEVWRPFGPTLTADGAEEIVVLGAGAVLAQASLAEVCGEDEAQDWLCVLVYEATRNEGLARVAGAGSSIVQAVLIVVLAYLLSLLLRRAVGRFGTRMERRIQARLDRSIARGAISDDARFRTRRMQRLHAVTGVLRGVIAVLIWLIALLQILGVFGVPLQPILAGAGLAGIVLGFGAQQLVRDVLAGIAMLIEDQYGVGDWIEVDGKYGQVERVGLRSTAFRDVDGVVHHVLNGYIQRVGNLSQEWARATLDVPIALDADIGAAKALIHKVATDLAEDAVWGEDIIGPPEIWGVQDLGPDGIRIRLVIPTKPLRNWDVQRQLRERLKFAFDQAHIRMPARLVDLGGQHAGYPVLGHDTDGPRTRSEPHPRGLVPQDVGPFDRPPTERRAADGTEVDEGARDGETPDPTVPPDDERDVTRELRIARGPEARPD
jgi:moderate conductance mechanosensitive channel